MREQFLFDLGWIDIEGGIDGGSMINILQSVEKAIVFSNEEVITYV